MAEERRSPTQDEENWMAWWNSLTAEQRAVWCGWAQTATPAVAWMTFKKSNKTGETT